MCECGQREMVCVVWSERDGVCSVARGRWCVSVARGRWCVCVCVCVCVCMCVCVCVCVCVCDQKERWTVVEANQKNGLVPEGGQSI